MLLTINDDLVVNLDNITAFFPKTGTLTCIGKAGSGIDLDKEESKKFITFIHSQYRLFPNLYILPSFLFNVDHTQEIWFSSSPPKLWFTNSTWLAMDEADVDAMKDLIAQSKIGTKQPPGLILPGDPLNN